MTCSTVYFCISGCVLIVEESRVVLIGEESIRYAAGAKNQNITDPKCFDFCSSSVRVCLFLVFVLVEVFPPLVWSVSLWVLDVFVSV